MQCSVGYFKKISTHNGSEGKSETDSNVEVADDLLDENVEEKPKGRKAKPKKLLKETNSGTVTSQKIVNTVSENGDVSDGNAERREGVENLPQTQRGEQERPESERFVGIHSVLHKLLKETTTQGKLSVINNEVNNIRNHLGLGSFEVGYLFL